MYLKKIEIAGFKSFADRTPVIFDNGLTAVVGPNGSGKSNITEAVRWVLGEQSAKSLRGGKMPDVIFAGCATRKQLNIAEVTLVLDNQDHFLPLDFNEISITRRLYRNGDSEFFINKQACRLKDIVELFMDSGLGRDSFSIISQGKVEAIFNSKPEDRRGIFEEAAGVLKYKKRKHKAEQKLFETEDNLNRLEDIIYELEAQLEPLREQADKATTYTQLQDQLRQVDVAVMVDEIDQAKLLWQEQQKISKELAQKAAEQQKGIEMREAEAEQLNESRRQLSQSLDNLQKELLAVTEHFEQLQAKREVLIERTQHCQQSSQQYQERLDEMTEKELDLRQQQEELGKSIKQKEMEQAENEQKIVELEKKLAFYRQSTQDQIAELRSEYVEVMQQQVNITNDLKHLERQYEQETNRHQREMGEYQTVLQCSEDLRKQQKQLQQEAEEITLNVHQQEQKLTDVQQQLGRYKQEALFNEKQLYEARGIIQQKQARKHSLQELQENYTGFYQGVRAVLQAKNQLSGIKGAVAELISVPAELAVAVETALGGAAQHVVTTDEPSARQAITFLKNKKLGRATFLPMSTIKPRSIHANVRHQFETIQGYRGIAHELIDYPKELAPIVANLLGLTIIAQDLASANQLARQINYQYRVVSLEGDVINAGGSMTGGATRRGNQGALFSQTNELKALTEQLQRMTQKYEQKQIATQQVAEQASELEKHVEQLRPLLEKARLKEQQIKQQLQHISLEVERVTKEQQSFEYEQSSLTRFLEDYQEQQTKLNQQLAKITARREQLDILMSKQDDLAETNRQTTEQLQQELSQVHAQKAVHSEQMNHFNKQLDQVLVDLEEVILEQQKVRLRLAQLTDNYSDIEHLSPEALANEMADLHARKEQIQSILTEKQQEREANQQALESNDQALQQVIKEQQQLLGEQKDNDVAISRTESQMDYNLRYLREEYMLTYEAAKEQKGSVTIVIESAKQQISQLKRSMTQLGNVNLDAVEQHQQVAERHDFLTTQRDDLLAAKAELFDTMSEMDAVVTEQFMLVFKQIREQFCHVFPQMFGGGHADLVLTDEEQLLTTGIEIVAQPPGKQLQSLNLLSGGEKALAAIALLFAIIQVRPVPFCILDEVEAALDDANVTRFGHYLKTFENDTQFIVITHRKGTMEAADKLYGITMQESGVSKIVSVNLNDLADDETLLVSEA